jgi:hypothetical protein
MNLRPSDLKTFKPLYKRKSEINPRITSEEKPPVVTTARKTLSENLGFVVMTRFGGKVGAAVLTRVILLFPQRKWADGWLREGERVVKLIPNPLMPIHLPHGT